MAEPSNHKSLTDPEYRDQTQTPPWLFAAFNFMYQYDLDAAATHKSAHCNRYFTPEDDALSIDWSETLAEIDKPTVWLNPPFSNIYPWFLHCLEQQKKGVLTTMFVPHENRAKWWPAGYPVKITDIVGYWQEVPIKSKVGGTRKVWRSGGIRFVNAKTGIENKCELNKPMCLIEFNPDYLGQETQYSSIQKSVLLDLGHGELNKVKKAS
ncbi:DNA N-6-adenine-methyltransferase [Pseudoalteromonas peptidolytica]|uniref:DNA N-6-adenine-methyltransferase n=1 Tax=Pseudoalteromonas peptidolytica F12-50-A1 TaxID=1315280 RepID=A0A8I0T5P3_9GAMM|nr:DNA N-6-adenine-methyltransferase [Pseudoalteromonas peptidolytica]MBE0348255.1 hypothetical protein [Pseudoalteromonas peptidolytica F12-50-A1]NLR16543.1 adenine methyltransferase [Pseudoalteromonas peptidolytica]GEK08909.1 phage N-6-adenine-methyltransferase [Pseudoalteromonas peptidolytica]